MLCPAAPLRLTACYGRLAIVYCFALSATKIVVKVFVTLSWMCYLSVLLIVCAWVLCRRPS